MKKFIFLFSAFLLPFSFSFANQEPVKTLGGVNFNEEQLVCNQTKITCGSCVNYNSYYKHSWIMTYPGVSFIEIEFSILEEDLSKETTLDFTHLSSVVNGQVYSPIKISVNDQIQIEKYAPNSGNWVHDKFNVTDKVKVGKNTVRIDFLPGAVGNYWINCFSVLSSENKLEPKRIYE